LLCFEGCFKYGCWCWSEVAGDGDEKEDVDVIGLTMMTTMMTMMMTVMMV